MRPARLAALAAVLAAAIAAAAGAIIAAPAALAATAGPAAAAAFAHAGLMSTQPADGSVVRRAPAEVTASFDQTVGITADSLVVYSPAGQRVDNGQAVHVSADEIGVGLRPGLGNGTYTAVWHVVSADTHPVGGAFTFSVGAPGATRVGALSPPTDSLVSGLFAVVRWLEYVCFTLLGGGVAFLIVCWPEGGRRADAGRLVTLSALGLVLTTLLGLLLQGPYAAGTGLGGILNASLVRTTLQSRLGPASDAREALCLLAAVVAAFILPRLPAASVRCRQGAGAIWALLITAVAGTWAVYGHASTGAQGPWGITDAIVHLDAVTLWIGGLAMLGGVALRGREIPDTDIPGGPGAAALSRAVPRFSEIAFGSVVAVVLSGVYQTWRETGAWGALVGTAYGRLILAKVTGMLALIALGGLARRYIRRAGAGRVWALPVRRLRRSVAAELVVAVVVLAFTALLVNTATGRETYAPPVSASQPFSTGGPDGAGTVHVLAAPARLGPNTIEVYFTGADGQAYVPAQVTAALYFPARGLGPLPVALARTAPGQYRTRDATVTFTGRWTLQVIVRSDPFDETSATFPVIIH